MNDRLGPKPRTEPVYNASHYLSFDCCVFVLVLLEPAEGFVTPDPLDGGGGFGLSTLMLGLLVDFVRSSEFLFVMIHLDLKFNILDR